MPTANPYDSLPNKEAIVAFNGKALLTTQSYLDLKAYQHALAFTVAGLMDKDLLKETRDAIKSALENGTDFRTFKQRLKPYLMSKGWLTETLEDGTQTLVAGSSRRLRTIYSTNLQTAYSAGQWSRIQQTKEWLPYLQYMPSVSENPRLEHKRYYGLCRPADDVIWQYIMPPNGWGCKCWVKQLTRRQAEKVGISEPTALDMEEYENPKTGEKSQIPVGIDPSFAHNHDPLTAVLRLAEDRHGIEFADRLKKQAEKLLPDNLPVGITNIPAVTAPNTSLPPPEEWQEVAKMGEELWQKHSDLFDAVDFDQDHAFAEALLEAMRREGIKLGGKVDVIGDATDKVNEILQRYPTSWLNKSNEMGNTFVRNVTSRGFQLAISDEKTLLSIKYWASKDTKLKIFQKFIDDLKVGDSLLKLNNLSGRTIKKEAFDITIHEMAHRLQMAMPELDAYFERLWIDRTKGETTRPLSKIQRERGEMSFYDIQEVGRKDKFAHVYIGRDYGRGADVKPKEVMTMTFQTLLASNTDQLTAKMLLERDPEMLYLGIALLMRFTP